jgi:hypothetical protein
MVVWVVETQNVFNTFSAVAVIRLGRRGGPKLELWPLYKASADDLTIEQNVLNTFSRRRRSGSNY